MTLDHIELLQKMTAFEVFVMYCNDSERLARRAEDALGLLRLFSLLPAPAILVLMQEADQQTRQKIYHGIQRNLPYLATDREETTLFVFGDDEKLAQDVYNLGSEILRLAPRVFPELK